MRHLVLPLLALCLSAAACGDGAQAPTAATAPAEIQRSTSGAFSVNIAVAASNSGHQVWSLRAELANNSVAREQYYFTWRNNVTGQIVAQGTGVYYYHHNASPTAYVDFTVEVTGPDGFATDTWNNEAGGGGGGGSGPGQGCTLGFPEFCSGGGA